ncbi:hypothetical protein CAPTEDRAFT_182272 [Capitella teleta]|uniref:Peroxidase n=1 Tax=Capitella teleta TaxID=283909 RepID=R7TS11_CAPTE|nr:hypothetical protein CAPTEDRAFT_182272 [Capitella teleta]|eukprot:ELT94281.1 hypothetical protein CAPTEDRAFT_182272 [Capitella teleta]
MLSALDQLREERIGKINADDVFPKPKFGSKTCLWPQYTCSASKYRSLDGSCNNLKNPLFGRAGIPFVRLLDSQYDNGVDSLRTKGVKKDLPGSRKLSTKVSLHQSHPHPLKTQAVMGFGQFLDHDFNFTPQETTYVDDDGVMRDVDCGHDGCDSTNPACSPIPVPSNDPAFNVDCLKFFRSVGIQDLTCSSGKREQENGVTAFIDGSQIYGSSVADSMALRDQSDLSRLNVTQHPFDSKLKALLPQIPTGCAMQGEYKCFTAGDGRVNEHHGLSIFHTIGHREHNRVEEVLHDLNPQWSGEKLFQEARQIVWAELQVITFKEFLPAILSAATLAKYDLELLEEGYYNDYDEEVDPSMANHFATATFRYGHSTVANEMETLSTSWDRLNFYKLRDVCECGIDGFMRGIVDQRSERCDRHLPVEMTDHLLLWDALSKSRERTDLFALNIRRARDHGLPGYNAYRGHCGLPKLTNFQKPDVFQDKSTSRVFRKQYQSVDDIDIFAGGISESPLAGGMVGETFSCLMGEQFEKLRKGDRFWFENPGVFTKEQLMEIRKASLGKVFCDNSDHIQVMQPNVMEVPFREAFPENNFKKYNVLDHGLSEAEFMDRWVNNFNARVACNELPTIDLGKWKDPM